MLRGVGRALMGGPVNIEAGDATVPFEIRKAGTLYAHVVIDGGVRGLGLIDTYLAIQNAEGDQNPQFRVTNVPAQNKAIVAAYDTSTPATKHHLDIQPSGYLFLRPTNNDPVIIVAADFEPGTTGTCSVGNASKAFLGGYFGNLSVKTQLGWDNGSGTIDTIIVREAANIVSLKNSTNAQRLRLYNTTDGPTTNYERGFAGWASNVFELGTEKGGTGTGRSVILKTDGTSRWTVAGTSGHFLASTDNSFDIGSSGALRPRNVFIAGYIQVSGLPTSNPAVAGRLWNDAGTVKVSAG